MLERLEGQIQIIEDSLVGYLPDNTPEPLKSSLYYAITVGGKRIRPLLTMLTCDLLGGNQDHAISTACAIEMVHTYSLIHDDLPAMDDDELRRGKPTLHVVYDDATAILTGDALQSLAFQIISEDQNLSDQKKAELVLLLAKAIGPEGMVAGQVLDMQSEQSRIGNNALKEMHNRKTGDLIVASIAAGASIANATPAEKSSLHEFGYALGLAFQIRDDLLDVLGTTEQLGKPQGSDQAKNKSTFTSIHGIEGAKTQLKETRDQALSALSCLGSKAETLANLTHYVADRLR